MASLTGLTLFHRNCSTQFIMHQNVMEIGKSIETESRSMVARGWAERGMESDCWWKQSLLLG